MRISSGDNIDYKDGTIAIAEVEPGIWQAAVRRNDGIAMENRGLKHLEVMTGRHATKEGAVAEAKVFIDNEFRV